MIQFKRRGGLAAVICSEPFVSLAQTQARVFRDPDLPLIVIKHPLGGISIKDVAERAAQALPQLVELLGANYRG